MKKYENFCNALNIIQETKNNYYNLFVDLKETLEKNWL